VVQTEFLNYPLLVSERELTLLAKITLPYGMGNN
jgi:hypothetical protein